MNGGAFTWPSSTGPVFYVTNTRAEIKLTGTKIQSSSGTLLNASAGDWGNNGSNGGTVTFIADGETLTGSVVSDKISNISLTLQNDSTLNGAINSAALTLDSTSTWKVTGTSVLTGFSDDGAISKDSIKNVIGNGYTVYYDQNLTANRALLGKTYTLVNGGKLVPLKSGSKVPGTNTLHPGMRYSYVTSGVSHFPAYQYLKNSSSAVPGNLMFQNVSGSLNIPHSVFEPLNTTKFQARSIIGLTRLTSLNYTRINGDTKAPVLSLPKTAGYAVYV
jgi:hypothetical protein